jgi:thiamine-phosphate diphosphorylase
VTDHRVLADPDLGKKAAAIAALGPAAALVLRDRDGTTAHLAEIGRRFVSLAHPPESTVVVSSRADLARALGADGVQLGLADLSVADVREVLARVWVGRSVHSAEEAKAAADEGADYLVAGHVFITPTHPDRPAAGLALISACVGTGLPVIAIGGVTRENAAECREAGAYGVAAIRSLWDAEDPYAAARALIAPWVEGE